MPVRNTRGYLWRFMLPSPYKRLHAFFYPVKLRSSSSAINPVLELYYFRGRYQLATGDALYSDGDRYRPLVAAFRALKDDFARLKNVLVLGTGLGSAAAVAGKMGFFPLFTFVDIDEQILAWAAELMPRKTADNARFIAADALAFIQKETGFYDLIVVDVFIGRVVPEAIISKDFLLACRRRLKPGGALVMNYMVEAADGISKGRALLEAVFGKTDEIAFGLNRVCITRNLAEAT